MKIHELEGLWVAKNTKENFEILIVAVDEIAAMNLAREYFDGSDMDSSPKNIEISAFDDVGIEFDCDYVIA